MKKLFLDKKNLLVLLLCLNISVMAAEQAGPAKSTDTSVVNAVSFDEGWILSDGEQRKDIAKYLKAAGTTVEFTAADNAVQYFKAQSLPAANGRQLELNFKAEGTGQGRIGFFTYVDEGWTHTDEGDDLFQNFSIEPASKEYKFSLPIKSAKVKYVRVVIGAAPNSKVKFSDLKINVK